MDSLAVGLVVPIPTLPEDPDTKKVFKGSEPILNE